MSIFSAIGAGLMGGDYLKARDGSYGSAEDNSKMNDAAGLFGKSVISNVLNNFADNKLNQVNAIRSAYGLSEMKGSSSPNLFSQGARAAEAVRIQEEADKQRAYANQAYGQTGPEYNQLQESLQEMLRAMKAGNATFRR